MSANDDAEIIQMTTVEAKNFFLSYQIENKTTYTQTLENHGTIFLTRQRK